MKSGTSSPLCSPLWGKTLAIVDVETSGTGWSDRIIEIGILRIENGECVETFQSLVNPERELNPWITRLTGITEADLSDAPLFADIFPTVERLLGGATFVAHNVGFDYAFVRGEFARLERHFEAECLCTVRLSRALSPRAKRHNLSAIIRRHKFACESRHRAFDDAHALWQLLQWGAKRHGAGMDRAIEKLLKTDRTAAYLNARNPERVEGELVIR